MELVRTKFLLEFVNPFNPWIEMRDMIRDVGEQTAAEIQGPPLVMDVPDKKRRIELHIKAFVLHQEGKDSLKEMVDLIAAKIEKIRNTIGIPRIRRIVFAAQFIDPYSLSFQDLLIKFRNRFFQNNSIIGESGDVGISLTWNGKDIIKHTQMGPMGKDQLLKQFLIWKERLVPDNFIFIENGYEVLNETDYEPNSFKDILDTASKWQENNAEKILIHLREEV